MIDPTNVKIPELPATLYALAGAVAHRTTPQNFARVSQFVQRMIDAGRGEFGVLLLRDAMQRQPAITQTTAFVGLAIGELGDLISGS